MKKTSANEYMKAFRRVFEEASDLEIIVDDKGLVSVKGTVGIDGIYFRLTLSRNDLPVAGATGQPNKGKRYLYSGTLSLFDISTGRVMVSEARKRKRERMMSGAAEVKDKDAYASWTLRTDLVEPVALCGYIRGKADALILENDGQILDAFRASATPEMLTPTLAVRLHLDDFLAICYGGASPQNDQRKRTIERVFARLPSTPFATMRRKEIQRQLQQDNVTESNIDLCGSFFDYLSNRGKVTGHNPFPSVEAGTPTVQSLQRALQKSSSISQEVFCKAATLLLEKPGNMSCVVFLLMSGFSWTEITGMTWDDVTIMKGFKDYVIVRLIKPEARVAMHDYSRPVIPDAARCLAAVKKKLAAANGADVIGSWHIAASGDAADTAMSRDAIVEAANNVLVLAGYGSVGVAGRPQMLGTPIQLGLLRDNYAHMLLDIAGLASDPDTYAYLTGRQLRSSTFINYETHTSDAAQYRHYTLLKPLSTEIKMRQGLTERHEDGRTVITASPASNHEAVQVSGTIIIPNGGEICVRSLHGANGVFRWAESDRVPPQPNNRDETVRSNGAARRRSAPKMGNL